VEPRKERIVVLHVETCLSPLYSLRYI